MVNASNDIRPGRMIAFKSNDHFLTDLGHDKQTFPTASMWCSHTQPGSLFILIHPVKFYADPTQSFGVIVIGYQRALGFAARFGKRLHRRRLDRCWHSHKFIVVISLSIAYMLHRYDGKIAIQFIVVVVYIPAF